VGRRYLSAVTQKAAFGGALAISLNRLSSTPAEPEEITATPVPKYSRRLQAGAGRLYSGLVAAWAERESSARASLLALVGRQGAASRRQVAAALPKSAQTKALWAAFKSLTAPEYAQLTADLYQQAIEARLLNTLKKIVAKAEAGGSLQQAKQELEALEKVQEPFRDSQTAMFADLGALLEATESPSGNLGPLAKAVIKQAAKLPKVPGLAKYAPQAGLVARLVSFGGAAFLPGKPKPFPAG
jgi:peptidyl-tRNA hydrolase